MNNIAIQELLTQLGLPTLPGQDRNMELLANQINDLLNNDFPKLISILYRLDINEEKLKRLLREQPGRDAGMIIAELMIERQIQKIKTKENPGSWGEGTGEEERW